MKLLGQKKSFKAGTETDETDAKLKGFWCYSRQKTYPGEGPCPETQKLNTRALGRTDNPVRCNCIPSAMGEMGDLAEKQQSERSPIVSPIFLQTLE